MPQRDYTIIQKGILIVLGFEGTIEKVRVQVTSSKEGRTWGLFGFKGREHEKAVHYLVTSTYDQETEAWKGGEIGGQRTDSIPCIYFAEIM